MVTLSFFLTLTVNINPLPRNYNTTSTERAYVSNIKLYLIICADVWSIDENSFRINLAYKCSKEKKLSETCPELYRHLNRANNAAAMPGFTLGFATETQQLPNQAPK